MIVDLRDAAPELSADVCIVGAGAAGISLARRLARHSVSVILCEAGGLEYSEESQAVYQGTVQGDEYYDLEVARLRYFGGTTNHWSGWCRALDAYDFEAKNGNPLTAWPIRIDALSPYLEETREILEVGPETDSPPLGSSGLKRITVGFSPPVRFGEKYRAELEASDLVTVILNANLVGASASDGRVNHLKVVDYGNNERSIAAKHFVIACGGIENSRLLMWLNESGQLPLPDSAGTVGRYWGEHPHAPVGDVVITRSDKFVFGEYALDFFAPTREFINKRNTLNCQLFLKTTHYGGAKELLADLLCTAPTLGKWAMNKLGKQLACVAELSAAWEQEPVASNRVQLGTDRDRFGIPRPILHWKRSALDFRTVRETSVAFAKYCADADVGRMKLADWLLSDGNTFPEIEQMGGYHHMGGTRMAATPRTGVVDSDCRLFDYENFFVAGSSVFPSVGHANPTFSIVQLSLRLADHLRDRLARS